MPVPRAQQLPVHAVLVLHIIQGPSLSMRALGQRHSNIFCTSLAASILQLFGVVCMPNCQKPCA